MVVDIKPAAQGLIVDQETLNHLPAFHRAVAEVLIDRGDWVLRSEGGDQK